MGTKTDKLVEQLADTHKRLRDSSSRSGMSAQDQSMSIPAPDAPALQRQHATCQDQLDVKPSVWSTRAWTPARDPSGHAPSAPPPGKWDKQLELDVKPSVWSTRAWTPARDPS